MADFRTIEFNGRTFQSFGFFLKKDNDYIDFADLNVETKQVEGSLNGADLSPAVSEENIERTYTFKTIPTKLPYQNEKKFLKVFVDYLTNSRNDYKILKDSVRKGYYCYAFLKSVSSLKKSFDGCFEISVTFSCKPYWYRERADAITKSRNVTASGQELDFELYNPEAFTAYPLIRITANYTGTPTTNVLKIFSGDLNNPKTFEILKIDSFVELDCENKNVYEGNNPRNNYVNLLQYPEFPKLEPGKNNLLFRFFWEGAYQVEISPRWRCL